MKAELCACALTLVASAAWAQAEAPNPTAKSVQTGASAGAAAGGPVLAVIGAAAGAVIGHSVAPPDDVRVYVLAQPLSPLAYDGELVVGQPTTAQVAWTSVPDQPRYSWACLNGKRVVIDNDRHVVAAIY